MIRILRHSDNTAAKIAAAPLCVRTIEQRLADDMRDLVFVGASVETLKLRGWTEPTLARIASDAASIARRQSVRQVA